MHTDRQVDRLAKLEVCAPHSDVRSAMHSLLHHKLNLAHWVEKLEQSSRQCPVGRDLGRGRLDGWILMVPLL